ncbi:MAG: dTMP kinase, partial [Verrucomicrobiota bacterium]
MAQTGKFITFEGTEGCGKSTQIANLRASLEERGVKTILTREPGGTALGEKIRELLQFDPEGEDMTPETELLLFTASRAQLVRQVIAPALAEGTWVIADRFFDSTTVYQGIGRGLSLGLVKAINEFAVGEQTP